MKDSEIIDFFERLIEYDKIYHVLEPGHRVFILNFLDKYNAKAIYDK